MPGRLFRYCGFYLLIFFLSAGVWLDFAFVDAQPRQAHLTLWTHHRHMSNVLKKLVQEFNSTTGKTKGIRLTLRMVGDDASALFQTAQNSGEGPDLYSSGFSTGYPDPVQAGAKIWLDDFPGFREWKEQWPSWYWIEGVTTYQGHVTAIPVQVINSRLIYNRDLFRAVGLDPDSPPSSYAELKEIARKITTYGKGRIYGFAFGADGSWWMEWMPSQWAEANGEPAYWDWKKGCWAMQGYARIFQLILDLEQEGSLFPGAVALTNDALRAQFAEGRIGMFMGESWDVGVLNDQFPAKCDWGVAPIPTWDGKFHGKPRAMIIGGLWSINGQSRYKEEAWEVVKWFDRYEIRAQLYEHGKLIDPDPLVVSEYVRKRPQVKGFSAFADSLEQDYLATYPVLPGWSAPTENPCTALRQLLSGDGTPRKALISLEKFWNSQLDQYYKDHPEVKRHWSVYPQFDRRTGILGLPLETPGPK